jgi:Flp pilus assembly pilin Flp
MHKLYEHVSLAVARVLTLSRDDLKREEGQGATEYGLVIAFLVIALAATVGLLGESIQNFLGDVGTALENLAP